MPPESESIVDRRYFWLQRFWALLGLTLIIFTWNLWTPQTVFPQIPFFEFLVNVPGVVDWILLSLAVASLVGVLLFRRGVGVKFSLIIFAVSASLMVSLDQHRLQPWMYQFIIYAIIMACCPARSAMAKLRWITVSIYLFSAVSKFDFQFAETLGVEFLSTLVGFVGLDPATWSKWLVTAMVVAFPAFEFMAGISLIYRPIRRIAIWAIVAMHLLLLLILGPLGLDHQFGVLVWNVYLLGQAVILFGWVGSTRRVGEGGRSEGNASTNTEQAKHEPAARLEQLAFILVAIVLAIPFTVGTGVCDHWLGWEVYAPRSSRAKLEIYEEVSSELVPFLVPSSKFNELDIERWSLETLHVPINPQARIQFAVASYVIESNDLRSFQVSIGGISNRTTGARKQETIVRKDRLKMKASQFWLNTKVRRLR